MSRRNSFEFSSRGKGKKDSSDGTSSLCNHYTNIHIASVEDGINTIYETVFYINLIEVHPHRGRQTHRLKSCLARLCE